VGKRRATELAEPYGGVWMGPRRREELLRRALSAQCTSIQRDKQYLVRDGKVQIIDEYTGGSWRTVHGSAVCTR
jgi:preprotein translocase subunit SecA